MCTPSAKICFPATNQVWNIAGHLLPIVLIHYNMFYVVSLGVELGHELHVVLVQKYFCRHHHQHYPFVLDWRLWTPGLGMTIGRRDVTRSKAQRARLVYSHLPDRITYLLMYHIMTLVGLEEYNWRQWR